MPVESSRTRPEWEDQAACLGVEPELFFPVSEVGESRLQVEAARRICATCAVRAECLELAIARNLTDGIWGGATPDDRRMLRRQEALRYRTARRRRQLGG